MKVARLLLLAALTAALLVPASAAAPAHVVKTRIGTAQLSPVAPGGPEGVAYLRQRGSRLSGWLAVWGLAPGSAHAWHVHGPAGACTPASANRGIIVGGQDLVANNLGVAFLQFAGLRTTTQVIARGFYVNVHEMSTPDGVGAGITCGNIIRVRIN